MAATPPTRIGLLMIVTALFGPSPTATPAEVAAPIAAPATVAVPSDFLALSLPEPHVDPELRHLVTWARARFETAGLELPAVDVYAMGPSEEHTDAARFVGRADGGEIHIHLADDELEIAQRRVLLHEFAHAWTHLNLGDGDRAAFIDRRGLDSWGEPAPWYLQAREHAAEVMAWALMDVELPVVTVLPNDDESLRASFVMLTGVEPPTR